MSDKVKFDLNSFGQQLIITGLAELVENEGHTSHEALEVVELVKSNIFFALFDLMEESESSVKKEN